MIIGMGLVLMMKKIDEIITKLEEISREDVAKAYELNGVAYAVLSLPEYLNTDLSYEAEFMLVMEKCNNRKRQILLKAINEIHKLNEECTEELEHIKHIKESNDRVEVKLKALGL